MSTLYPLTFKPFYKAKIWGGQKINRLLGMNTGSLSNCGEAWLISGVDGNPSVVSNGYLSGNELNDLCEVYMGDLMGDKVHERFGNEFPILVKVIDANDWLSIQVHPDDALAQKRAQGSGKTEMWYTMQADEDARLICGFNRALGEELYLKHLKEGKITEVLNYESVAQGDVFYIPAGRVHALGPGLLIAEIQQTSDTTYRIYDWDRLDDKGMPRELHTDLALEAIDFTFHPQYKIPYDKTANKSQNLVSSPYFTTNILKPLGPLQKSYNSLDSFVILMCVSGSCQIHGQAQKIDLNAGGLVLLPNASKQITIVPDKECVLLEVYIE
jgi:mannose-6-phosphate isomerase